MRFDVKRRASYTLAQDSIKAFKERMLERFEEECSDEDKEFTYTIEDISDDIIKEPLAELIQYAFEDCEYYQGGVHFDDYFSSVWLECGEDDVSDCIYDAIEIWKTRMEV